MKNKNIQQVLKTSRLITM